MDLATSEYGNSSSIIQQEQNDSFNSLPDCLKTLEPEILSVLIQDPSYMMFILNEDGTLNESKVANLKSQIMMSNNQYYVPPNVNASNNYSNGYINPQQQQQSTNGYGNFSQPQTQPFQSQYQQSQQQLPTFNVGGYSVPSLNDLSTSGIYK